MLITELKQQADAIKRGDYEKWAFDERVDRATAIAILEQQVKAIAWQPGYKEEAYQIIADLKASFAAIIADF